MPTQSGVYALSNHITGRSYVGGSKDLAKRQYMHFWMLRNSRHQNPFLQADFDQYGAESFSFDVLEYAAPTDIADIEQKHIDSGEHTYNLARNARGGDFIRDHPRRDEILRKVSASRSGEKNHHYGKRFSDEHRQRLSAAHTGKRHTDESKRKIGAAVKGRKQSAETRAKRSGENNCHFTGWYVTPWGRFATARQAMLAIDGKMALATIVRICKDPSTSISRQSVVRSAYLQSLTDSPVGKTYGDIGFGFEPVPQA